MAGVVLRIEAYYRSPIGVPVEPDYDAIEAALTALGLEDVSFDESVSIGGYTPPKPNHQED